MTIEYINGIKNAPKAVGPYSQAVKCNGFLFLSGQIGLNPESAAIVDGGIENQTRQVLDNIRSVLAHHKLGFGDVVKTTIFLTDLGHFKTVNGIYEEYLSDSKPARSTVQVAALPLGAIVEIEMTAFCG